MLFLQKIFRKYLYLLPIINYLITVYVYFIPIDTIDWVFIGNLGGYSIVTSLVYVGKFCFSRVYCFFTKAICVGLLLIFNTISCNLFTTVEEYQVYEALFAKIVTILIIILTISLSTLKCKRLFTQ